MPITPEREIEIEQEVAWIDRDIAHNRQATAQVEGGQKAALDAAALAARRSKRALRAGAADLLRNGP